MRQYATNSCVIFAVALSVIMLSLTSIAMTAGNGVYAYARTTGTLPTARHGASINSARVLRWRAGDGTVVESGQAPLPAQLVRIENHWFAEANGEVIIVYAGAERRDPQQGLVVVERARADYTSVSAPIFYRTPRRLGAVRIVGATGHRLQLATSSGAHFSFDAARAHFA